MKYNLNNLYWQEFEDLSFKVLQILVSPSIQFYSGGNDSGRDITYNGTSDFNKDFSGHWIFQVKHKSKQDGSKELIYDLHDELTKVFIKNDLPCDNYILVTNLLINANVSDELLETFDKFISKHGIPNKNFLLITYHHFESCIEQSDSIKWAYPQIVSSEDFKGLIESAINRHLITRQKAWIRGAEKRRELFVETNFFCKATERLLKYPAIILSGPPKSGKTFNAEILALNYCTLKNYEPVVVESPDDIENSYVNDRQQVFICDDAFGRSSLIYDSDDWASKLERLLGMADANHLFIFTTREYIFRSFINESSPSNIGSLEKIIVESHSYSVYEKLTLLNRYLLFSSISDLERRQILAAQNKIVEHKNFSPETIRSFFSKTGLENKSNLLVDFFRHLDQPDEYLGHVFFQLTQNKQAALIAVLCAFSNDEGSILRVYNRICNDWGISINLVSKLEFEELDDSILRISRSERIESISYYHPSMQEFLVRQFKDEQYSKLREIVLMNFNLELLFMSALSKNVVLNSFKSITEVELISKDINSFDIGVKRMMHELVSVQRILGVLKWFTKGSHTIEAKLNNRVVFDGVKPTVQGIVEYLLSKEGFVKISNQNCQVLSELLRTVINLCDSYSIERKQISVEYINDIVQSKSKEDDFWQVVFRLTAYNYHTSLKETVGRKWFRAFYEDLKKEIYSLGNEIFGDDFPDFKEHKRKQTEKVRSEKVKNKPSKDWYARFQIVESKIKVLKENKGNEIGKFILDKLIPAYDEISRQKDYAKNRNIFNRKKGWWV
jgi:hypothetical protein